MIIINSKLILNSINSKLIELCLSQYFSTEIVYNYNKFTHF